MKKIAELIVRCRNLMVLIFIAGAIGSILMASRVNVINELTEYLPESTETRQGVDLMDDEFVTFGTAKVMIQNISYQQTLKLVDQLEEIKGVSSVKFYEEDDEDEQEITDAESLADVYNSCNALLTINFETEEEEDEAQYAIAGVRSLLAPYDCYFYTTVDQDDSRDLQQDMKGILILAVIIIILVLLFTSTTYMEIPIFMLVFGMAALLNLGTNFIFGDISFISNAVGSVLQLALAIDYAIILFHRFMEEKLHLDTEEALIEALSKAIPEISSSSLTTVAGMVALMFMQFGIGPDLGRVLTKAIILSMLSVFCFMPALIMQFDKQIAGSMHKSFVPKINLWGRFVVLSRFVTLPIFCVVVVGAIYCSSKCNYIYDKNSVESAKMNEYLTARREISEYFDLDNTMAILVPKGDYESEGKILERIENLDRVENTLGMSNITVDSEEKYVLIDKLTPQEFSEVADLDVESCRLLYRFYAWKEEKYGALLNSIDDFEVSLVNLIDFIYGEEQNETFDFGTDQSKDIEDMHKAVSDARAQLEGQEYSRLIFTMSGPVEGEETFALIDEVRAIAQEYYNEVYVVGDATSDYDLSKSFLTDNLKISIMTALFVFVILFFTFDSISVPILLVATIQASIWINFSVPFIKGDGMFFLSYLIVSSIQMGATIDYAIVITSRYMTLRQTMANKAECITQTLNESFATIVTSGTILTVAAFAIGRMTSNSVIASLGSTLGVGTLTSIILVMLVLPQLLYTFDNVIQISFWRNRLVFANARNAKKRSSVKDIEDELLSGDIVDLDSDADGILEQEETVIAETAADLAKTADSETAADSSEIADTDRKEEM